MPVTDRSSKDVFITSLFNMYYEQECLVKLRKKLLRFVRIVDAATVVVPSFILGIIGINPDNLKLWMAISVFINVAIALLRFFPFYNKAKESHERFTKIESIVNLMNLEWRMYQLGLSTLEHFTETHKTLYQEYCNKCIDSANEVYDWKDKEVKNVQAQVMRYMEEYASSEQIYELIEKITNNEGDRVEE